MRVQYPYSFLLQTKVLECLLKILLFINNNNKSQYLDNFYCYKLTNKLSFIRPIVINFLEMLSYTDTHKCHCYLSV